jgi:hypothetical protein
MARSWGWIALTVFAAAGVLRADVLVLHDGKLIEGDLTEQGDVWQVKTKYGALTVAKADVKKILKDPSESVAEAESLRKQARRHFDEAQATAEPSDRNRRLDSGLELLDQSLKIYTETREIFWGSAYNHLDKAITTLIQEMRLYRDKKVSQSAAALLKPQPPDAGKPPAPAPAPEAKPAAGGTPVVAAVLVPVAPPAAVLDKPQEALGSPDAQVRRRALAAVIAMPKTQEIAKALGERLTKETEADLLAALTSHATAFDPPTALQILSRAGEAVAPEPRRAAVLAVKRLDGEGPANWLISTFLLKNETSLLPEVTSALKKMEKASLPILNRHAARIRDLEVRKLLLKVIGVIADPSSASFFVGLTVTAELKPIPAVALLKIGRPAIPALIRGLGGTPEQRNICGALLRKLTRLPWNAAQAWIWSHWWSDHSAEVEAALRRKDQLDAEHDWPVTIKDFQDYDQSLDDVLHGDGVAPGEQVPGSGRGGGGHGFGGRGFGGRRGR